MADPFEQRRRVLWAVCRYVVDGLMHLGLGLTCIAPWAPMIWPTGEEAEPVELAPPADPGPIGQRVALTPYEEFAWVRLVSELRASVMSEEDLP